MRFKSKPKIVNVPNTELTVSPQDLSDAYMPNLDNRKPLSEYPLILWNDYMYYIYQFKDNRDSINIVAYNSEGIIVKQWEKPGIKKVAAVTIVDLNNSITFWEDEKKTLTMKWDDLLIDNVHFWGFDEKIGLHTKDTFGGTYACLSPNAKREEPGYNSPGAIMIDGSDHAYVSFGPKIGQFRKNDFSICFWLKTNEIIRYFDLIGNRTSYSHGNFFCVRMTGIHESGLNGIVSVEIDEDIYGKNYIEIDSGTKDNLNNGKWHHIAVVRKGASLKLYINGILEACANGEGIADINNCNEFIIGRSLKSSDHRFAPKASFDNLYICQYAFSDKEVYDIFSQKGLCESQ